MFSTDLMTPAVVQRNIARSRIGVKLVDEDELPLIMTFSAFKDLSIPDKMSLLDAVFDPLLQGTGHIPDKLRNVIAPMAKHFCSNWEEYTSNIEMREDDANLKPAGGNIPSSVLIVDTLKQNVEMLQDDITKTMANVFEDNREMDKTNQERKRLNYAWR